MSFEFFIRDFPGKEIKWKKFLKGFLWKIEAGGKILKGFPFKFTTCLVSVFFFSPVKTKTLPVKKLRKIARESTKLPVKP